MEREVAWKKYDEAQLAEMGALAADYIDFISDNKTERECAAASIELAEKAGYRSLDEAVRQGRALVPGDKVWACDHGKAVILVQLGRAPLAEGANILGAHIDSPRLDLKQNPLYESNGFAFLDTHYYGGIKHYQWVTLPLALHGVIAKKDGTVVEVRLGEDPGDPVFCVTDLLPHLGNQQMGKKASEVVEGEALDVLVGNRPARSCADAPAGDSATRRSAAQPSASCASLLQSDEYIDGVQTVSAPSDGSPLGTNMNPEKRQTVAPLVPPACQPAELADAAVFSGTAPRGDDGGSRTEIRFASAIPAIRGTGEALADVTNDMDVDSLPVWSRASVLEARDVAFDYVDHRALSGVSFSVRGFSKVAIVGMSGSGKSTLANLLGGFAEPSEGGFLSSWEGEEPRAFDLASDAWRRQVVYIPQDPYIFHATLRENIAFYRPDADDAAIEGAVEAMGLGELVRQLPQGLDTSIGEGARALSGGQAQRIALARAFLDPQRCILIFDEPTAHLDIETELELKERMLPLMEGRLVFFATHRLQWIHDMDAVMVVDGGRLAEFGAPEELLSRGGALARLAEHMLGGAR